MPKAIEGLDKSKYDDIYKNIIDLESVFPVKSYNELKSMLDEHYFCTSAEQQTVSQPAKKNNNPPVTQTAEDLLEDDTVKQLLADIEDSK